MPSPLPTIDFIGEMQRVSGCNPNSLYPYASLHRTKEFSEAGAYDFCPTVSERFLRPPHESKRIIEHAITNI